MQKIILILLVLFSFCKEIAQEKVWVFNTFGATKWNPESMITFPNLAPYGEELTKLKEVQVGSIIFFLVSDEKKEKFLVKPRDVTKNFPDKLYVRSITGITTPTGKQIGYREQVKFISTKIQTNPDLTYFIVKFGEEEFESHASNFSEVQSNLYYKVVSNTGLNLREGPGVKFKILKTLPFETIGEVESINPKVESIQGKVGYWINVKFESQQGWLFSGFLLTATTKDELTSPEKPPVEKEYSSGGGSEEEIIIENNFSGDDYNFQLKELESSSLASTKVSSYKSGNIAVTVYDFIAKTEDDKFTKDCGFNAFVRFKSPKLDGIISGYDLILNNEKAISSGYLFYSSRSCGCCCAQSSDKILAISEEGMEELVYDRSGRTECSTVEVEFLNAISATEIRLDSKTKTLYILREIPLCSKTQGSSNTKFTQNGSKYFFYKFKRGTYSMEREMEEINSSSSIPAKWEKEWSMAEPLL